MLITSKGKFRFCVKSAPLYAQPITVKTRRRVVDLRKSRVLPDGSLLMRKRARASSAFTTKTRPYTRFARLLQYSQGSKPC